MDFLIDFFRGIDGPLYYLILVVNTILIFAIIGYLGEKSNEQMMKTSINTEVNMRGSNTLNMNASKVIDTSNVTSIPKISATPINRPITNQQQPISQNTGQINQNLSNTNVNKVISQPVQSVGMNQAVMNPQTVNNSVPLQSINNSANINSNNQNVSQEKAPAVLVINSSNNSKI